MQAIDPQVTGMPALGRFMVQRAQRALTWTAALGVALLALWLIVSFRRLLPAVLAAMPSKIDRGVSLLPAS